MRRMAARWGLLLCMLLMTHLVVAQIRIIPRATRDSVNHPTILESKPIAWLQGDEVDFGTLNEENAPWQGSVSWRNRGEQPLVITRITSSCGCLQATYERQPVAAGAEATIGLTYHPKGHPGTVYQRLFVYTQLSASRPTAILTLRGIVTPSKRVSATYPQAMGPLRLRAKQAMLQGDEREVRIACANSGQTPLRITTDTLLTPQGWQIGSEPSLLEAGAEGDLVIRRMSNAAPRPTVTLYVGGLQLPPRARALQLTVEE